MAGTCPPRKLRGVAAHDGKSRRLHKCDRRKRPKGLEADATPFSAYASDWLERKRAALARSTYGDYRLSHGEDPLWVARMLGHTSLDMIFRHYGKFNRNRSRKDGGRFLEGLREAEEAPDGKA